MNDQRLAASLRAIHTDPSLSPDADAVYHHVLSIPIEQTPQQRGWRPQFPKWRSHSMFSALKFVAAGVIVALFGGFLLTGVLTTPQGDEMAPAAVSASPEPEATTAPTEPTLPPDPSVRTDILPGVALTVEEVEPGVYRAINDGVRDLAKANNTDIVASHDGGIWLLRQNRFFPLGDDRTHEWPENRQVRSGPHPVRVASDGTVWAIVGAKGEGGKGWFLRSYDGTRWSDHRADGFYLSPSQNVDVAPDGSVWVSAWADGIFVFDPDGWRSVEPPAGLVLGESRMVLADDGDPIVFGFDEDSRGFSSKRYHDGDWHDWRGYRIDDAEKVDELDGAGGDAAFVGPDGTMWAVIKNHRTSPPTVHFKRLDSAGTKAWEWVSGEGVPYPGNPASVAPDGSLWIPTYTGDCAGVIHFGGDTWSHHLPDRCIHQMDIAADGNVWVLASDSPDRGPNRRERRDLYVISHAFAASESP